MKVPRLCVSRAGFAGELTMSEKMEALMNALYMDKLPPSWAKMSWPSLRPLSGWLVNLTNRLQQLEDWTGNPSDIPKARMSALLSMSLAMLGASEQPDLSKLPACPCVHRSRGSPALSTRSPS
jgi:hypothetical protein